MVLIASQQPAVLAAEAQVNSPLSPHRSPAPRLHAQTTTGTVVSLVVFCTFTLQRHGHNAWRTAPRPEQKYIQL